eukprot:6042182-Heterocapsa_arctica.AAC.1
MWDSDSAGALEVDVEDLNEALSGSGGSRRGEEMDAVVISDGESVVMAEEWTWPAEDSEGKERQARFNC